MSISYSFVDNIRYGTDDINDITRSLVGAGVAPFLSKDTYTVSKLNALTEALVERGVQLDGCKCSIETIGNKNIIKVGQGIIFFENGTRLTVDSDGYQIETDFNEPGYVFAVYSAALQTAEIVFGPQLPDDRGIAVSLAEVTEKNEIKDKREIARSKIGTFGRNVSFETTIPPVTFDPKTAKPYLRPGRYALAKVDVDLSRFNLVYIKEIDADSGGIFDLKENKFLISAYGSGNAVYGHFDTNTIYMFNTTSFDFEVVDDTLTYFGDCGNGSTYNIEVNCNKTFRLLFV